MKNIIIFLFFIVPVFSQNWFQSRLIQKQLDMAVDHFNEDRFATTETILSKLLEKPLGAYEATARILLLKTTYALKKIDKTKEIGREFLQSFPADQHIKDVFLKFGDIFIDEGNFGAVAAAVSEDVGSAQDGGDMGWAPRGFFVPEFEDVAYSLEKNEISQPFRTRYGWHIIEFLGNRVFDNTEEIQRIIAKSNIMYPILDSATPSKMKDLQKPNEVMVMSNNEELVSLWLNAVTQ